jgi:cytochrome c biogenesis protein CcdA
LIVVLLNQTPTKEILMAEYETESIPGLIRSVLDDTRELIGEEIALARAEMQEEMTAARTVGIAFGAAAVFAVLGATLLCISLGQVIAYFLQWPTWAGYGIVAVLALVTAYFVVQYGRRHLANVHALPKTTETVKENLAWQPVQRLRAAGMTAMVASFGVRWWRRRAQA